MISNVETQLIFCDFLTSCDIDLPTIKITEECYKLKEQYKSNLGSNVGGWQSPKLEKSPYPEIKKLQEVVNNFTITHLQRMGFICSEIFSAFWVNINSNTNYNTIHTHGRADCIGVYFVKSPKGSGDLGILRNDGSSYTITSITSSIYITRTFLQSWTTRSTVLVISSNTKSKCRCGIRTTLIVFPSKSFS